MIGEATIERIGAFLNDLTSREQPNMARLVIANFAPPPFPATVPRSHEKSQFLLDDLVDHAGRLAIRDREFLAVALVDEPAMIQAEQVQDGG